MHVGRFHRAAVFFLIVLAAVAGMLLWFNRSSGMQPPELVRPAGDSLGAFGPVVLKFRQPVNGTNVESNLRFEPAIEGNWTWEGNQASFRPTMSFQIGQTYTLRLLSGVADEQGRILSKDAIWTFTVRAAEVVYLGQVGSGLEVWLANPDTGEKYPLTSTGGKVQDFAGFPGGEQVVYSSENDSGGADLWLVDRLGKNARMLFDCGTDTCVQPTVALDETAITYSRRTNEVPQGEIWLFDLVTGKNEPLYADQAITGIEPNWSPQGRYLQFYDPEYAQLRVLDLINDRVILIPTNQEAVGSWSPDGQKILFTRAESSEFGPPFVKVYQADLSSGDISPVEISSLGQVDSSRPIFSPDGSSLVMALRGLAGSANKQLWLVALDGSNVQAITDDPAASFAAYAWDPDGTQLVFQRLQLETSQSRPQVMLWRKADGKMTVLAENAAWPQWLP